MVNNFHKNTYCAKWNDQSSFDLKILLFLKHSENVYDICQKPGENIQLERRDIKRRFIPSSGHLHFMKYIRRT